jgi:hypothetical protein
VIVLESSVSGFFVAHADAAFASGPGAPTRGTAGC